MFPSILYPIQRADQNGGNSSDCFCFLVKTEVKRRHPCCLPPHILSAGASGLLGGPSGSLLRPLAIGFLLLRARRHVQEEAVSSLPALMVAARGEQHAGWPRPALEGRQRGTGQLASGSLRWSAKQLVSFSLPLAMPVPSEGHSLASLPGPIFPPPCHFLLDNSCVRSIHKLQVC